MRSDEAGIGGEAYGEGAPAATPKPAKRRKKEPPPKVPAPAWVVLFSNLMALLMTFFIVLVTFSTVQEENVKRVLASLAGAGLLSGGFGVKFENATQPLPGRPISILSGGQQTWDVGELARQLNIIKKKKEQEKSAKQEEQDKSEGGELIDIGEGPAARGIVLRIEGGVLFRSGEAVILRSAYPLLDNVAEELKKIDNDIIIEGHTDNVPINTPQFASNWELSLARSMALLRYLQKRHNISENRISVVGYADTVPIETNTTPEGRAKNRRVEVLILEE